MKFLKYLFFFTLIISRIAFAAELPIKTVDTLPFDLPINGADYSGVSFELKGAAIYTCDIYNGYNVQITSPDIIGWSRPTNSDQSMLSNGFSGDIRIYFGPIPTDNADIRAGKPSSLLAFLNSASSHSITIYSGILDKSDASSSPRAHCF